MPRTALLLMAVSWASADAIRAQQFEFKFAGCREVTGAAGTVVPVEIDVVLNASQAGVTGMIYKISGSSDEVEFLLKANHPVPCDAICIGEFIPGADYFFFEGAPVDPDRDPVRGPLAGMGPQGQGYVAAIAYNPFSDPPFQLPAGDSIVGKLLLEITMPSDRAGGFVVLRFEDGMEAKRVPKSQDVGNGVIFNNATYQPTFLHTCTIQVTSSTARSIPFDADGNNALDVLDALEFLDHYFRGDPPTLPCGKGTIHDPANIAFFDSNGDGELDLADAVHIMQYIFLNGRPHSSGEGCRKIIGCPDFCGPVGPPEFEFEFAGCRDITGAAGSVVPVEVDLVLDASVAGVTEMVYGLTASSPDGLEFLLRPNHRMPCSATCIEELIPDLDFLFFGAYLFSPEHEPTTGPLQGLGPQGQGYGAGIAFNPLTRPPFTLPAGESVVGKIRVDVTIPDSGEGGTVILQFKDGLQGTGGGFAEPAINSVRYDEETHPVKLGSCAIEVSKAEPGAR